MKIGAGFSYNIGHTVTEVKSWNAAMMYIQCTPCSVESEAMMYSAGSSDVQGHVWDKKKWGHGNAVSLLSN